MWQSGQGAVAPPKKKKKFWAVRKFLFLSNIFEVQILGIETPVWGSLGAKLTFFEHP